MRTLKNLVDIDHRSLVVIVDVNDLLLFMIEKCGLCKSLPSMSFLERSEFRCSSADCPAKMFLGRPDGLVKTLRVRYTLDESKPEIIGKFEDTLGYFCDGSVRGWRWEGHECCASLQDSSLELFLNLRQAMKTS